MAFYITDQDIVTNETIASFRVNNGCLLIPLAQSSFSRVVISGLGVTFHWNEGAHAAAHALEDLMMRRNIENVDGNYTMHEAMHFDEADKAQPHLHGHFLGNIEDVATRLNFLEVIEKLTSAQHFSPGECGRIGGGILAYMRL